MFFGTEIVELKSDWKRTRDATSRIGRNRRRDRHITRSGCVIGGTSPRRDVRGKREDMDRSESKRILICTQYELKEKAVTRQAEFNRTF